MKAPVLALFLAALPACGTLDRIASTKLPAVQSAQAAGLVASAFAQAVAAGDQNQDGFVQGTSEWTVFLTTFVARIKDALDELRRSSPASPGTGSSSPGSEG